MVTSDQHISPLGRQARERFVTHLESVLPEVVKACETRLSAAIDQACPAPEMQQRRDAWMAFQKSQTVWLNQTRKALRTCLLPREPAASGSRTLPTSKRLELLSEGAVDDQIFASRLAMRVLDVASTELNELRLRVQHLEQRTELPSGDVLLPDVVARTLLNQWLGLQMTREGWALVQDAMSQALATGMLASYKQANDFLISSGVMREIDLQAFVKRTPGGRAVFKRERFPDSNGGSFAGSRSSRGEWSPSSGHSGPSSLGGGSDDAWSVRSGGTGLASRPLESSATATDSVATHDETRQMTHSSPLARARMRAQGVVGRLQRMFLEKVGGDFEATQLHSASDRLQQVMRRVGPVPVPDAAPLGASGAAGSGGGRADVSHVQQAASALRQHTTELKQAASSPTERATIEVVALMFQSILAEERIPPSVRVWFARLQMPVLRVALAEPEFFSVLHHPARRLIDRMGSCVMGFESNVNALALETEIKRAVQVIEQYPETGRRVFQLVHDEFQTFLATYLSERGNASRYVSVAQQVEQKETLLVKYTIELRKLLDDIPVRDEVRQFLFKVWVEVLAVASVKYGLKHQETTALKRVASDLLWAASAKPNRSDRARVIQQLPGLLQRLRQGMGLLGYSPSTQDQHLKSINDTLADAFMSRTDLISQESLDQLSERLAQLENFLSDSGVGDLDLDNESIELITGVDAGNIVVIKDGGSQPSEAMRAWTLELQVGAWFGLDHNGKLNSVQFAWRSQRGQLYLFATNSGRCFLIQANRVAAYLQAGLLVPSEEEALTVRATRNALTKLDANPERLLG